jgi:hypothetical protein
MKESRLVKNSGRETPWKEITSKDKEEDMG